MPDMVTEIAPSSRPDGQRAALPQSAPEDFDRVLQA